MYHKYSLYISPYNLAYKMTKSDTDPHPNFLQYGRNSKFGSIFGLSLPYLSSNSTILYRIVPHFLHEKPMYMGAYDLIHFVLASYDISEVSKYIFDMEKFTVTPKTLNSQTTKITTKGYLSFKP